MEYRIIKYQEAYRNELLAVWERSVLATHHFLGSADFEAIKQMLHTLDFAELNVFCLMEMDKLVGFIGLDERKIEMLFLDPDYIGKGLGKKMMTFAFDTFEANSVDVNEQNQEALKFYQKFGFVVFERAEKDGMGKNYPILKMKLIQ